MVLWIAPLLLRLVEGSQVWGASSQRTAARVVHALLDAKAVRLKTSAIYQVIQLSNLCQALNTLATPVKLVSTHALHMQAGINTFATFIKLASIHAYHAI